jgi:hypothetical protein
MRSQLQFLAKLSTVVVLCGTPHAAALAQSTNKIDLSAPELQPNSRLWRHNPPGDNLTEMLVRAHNVADERGLPWKGLDIIVSEGLDNIDTRTLATAFQKKTCKADAILIGRSDSAAYHLSETQTSVYGDYSFVIDDILKSNSSSLLVVSQKIVVTRPGGSISLFEGPVNVRFDAYPQFKPNMSYLLFLRYLPQSKSYEMIDSSSTLEQTNVSWQIATKSLPSVNSADLSRDKFISSIQKWLGNCR